MIYEAAEPLFTSRMQGFDCGRPGLYFITVCTQDRHPWFGEVRATGMFKSPIGEAAEIAWLAIPGHFPDVRIYEFCVMPDHVHGLLEIEAGSDGRNQTGNKFGPQSRNLASIVRGYKIGVTKIARGIDTAFRWQPRYWDRVVRDLDERDRIRLYILENAATWWKRR
jgi:REP element-mobilizing transposase RayT